MRIVRALMKTTSVLSSVLIAAACLGACDKGDKKSETKEPAAETGDTAGTAAGTGAATGTGAAEGTGATAGTGAADTTGSTTGAGTPTGSTTGATGGSLEVLAEGSEPRYLLKYQAPAGTKQKMEMAMDITMDMMGMTVNTPTMIMKADVEVVSVAGDQITNKMTFSDVDIKETKDSMPGVADAMRGAMDKIKGVSTTMVIAPNGKVISMKVDAPNDPMLAQTMQQTQQGLDQMVAQLPDKPVGKGAKWRAKQTIDQNGMKIDQTIVFEVVEVSATTAKIKGVATMSAPKQDINQGGMTMTLEKMDGSGTTDLDIDFTKVVPAVKGNIDMKMKISAMGQSQEMAMKMKMDIHAGK